MTAERGSRENGLSQFDAVVCGPPELFVRTSTRREGAVGQPSLDRDVQHGITPPLAVPSTANSHDVPEPFTQSGDALIAPNTDATPESFRIVSSPTLAITHHAT